MSKESFFWTELLTWYTENGRHQFPWRNTKDPYHVLIAEFLLQQTHVRKVEEVYSQLLLNYPNISELAKANTLSLEGIIAPIGLKYRASRLIRTAQMICSQHNGIIPNNYNILRQFPGVGDYIANAVLCYAFDQPVVPIDTNVIRLFTRYFGYTSKNSRPRMDKELASKIRAHFDGMESTRVANLAVLDFAGAVCTAKSPKSLQCPLSKKCLDFILQKS
ncbi:A/G-specific adenine glycosylase [Paenibacillus frigoriresistens]|uniref:A/G-specific adenine glycosylase n=1 Tax=Paenibacillus alginolyticus TaxID=59839 RepID=UPI0015633F73|nr:A/G-specific adenine glycosylase [Paenibacillus frigoriresistens]NRF96203.1 A/G-specific adenine glycosylase [Paenibacillus frigoriresistens]